MILIDLTYINSPGGITLAKEVLNEIFIKKLENKVEILLDKRNNEIFETIGLKKKIIKGSELDRYFFYKRNVHKYKSILCFANVPPPFKTRKKVYIYFHNELLLNTNSANFSFFKQFIFLIKKFYIKNRNNNYKWIVQTDHIRDLLVDKLEIKHNKIYKHPIFSERKIVAKKTSLNTFIYPSSNNPHKNNSLLIKAFVLAAEKTDQQIELKITIKESDIKTYKNTYPSNLKVEYLGIIDYKQLLKIYNSSKFLIFPSLRESFGLPLIEGIQSGCIILAPKLNYVNELISPAYKFEVKDANSISKSILEAIKNKNHKLQSIKVKSDLDKILKKLINV
jgi:hypothetical protein